MAGGFARPVGADRTRTAMSSVHALPATRARSIAVIGSGVAGLSAAAGLHAEHAITVYEAAGWIGGHTNTVEVEERGRRLAIDTGFIVCNDRTYPRFTAMLARLGVATQAADMSFGLQDEASGLEYSGSSLATLFAQPRNLLSPGFVRMLAEILRFNCAARDCAAGPAESGTLGDWLAARGFGRRLAAHYVVPMGRAIWSVDEAQLLGFPARFFCEFFTRHGLLSISDRPQWRSVVGGAREYVRALSMPFRSRIRLSTPVAGIRRLPHGVAVRTRDGAVVVHDLVVLACHADTALALLADPSPAEREVLGAFAFQPNEAVLHTDARVLPRAERARAAWNYHALREPRAACTVTYDMNVLQSLDAERRYLVSLNLGDRIDPARVLGRFEYAHPVYTPAAVAAQHRHAAISGERRTFYCGAYWGCGFHEDGVASAHRVLEQIEAWSEEHAERAVSRLG